MSSQGPLYGGTAANDASAGQRAWSNVNNALASDDSRASVTLTGHSGSGYQSNLLNVTNFGFSIPTGATIDGILVEVEGYRDTNWGSVSNVYLSKSGSAFFTQNSISLGSGSDSFASAGSSSDLWSSTWTPADINNSAFGAAFLIQCFVFDATDGRQAFVDSIRITVYYTAAASTYAPPSFRRSTRFFRQR